MAERQSNDLWRQGHHNASEQQPEARLLESRQKNRPGVDFGQPDESCKSKRCHERYGAIRNVPEQRVTSPQMADQKPGEQSTHAGT